MLDCSWMPWTKRSKRRKGTPPPLPHPLPNRATALPSHRPLPPPPAKAWMMPFPPHPPLLFPPHLPILGPLPLLSRSLQRAFPRSQFTRPSPRGCPGPRKEWNTRPTCPGPLLKVANHYPHIKKNEIITLT